MFLWRTDENYPSVIIKYLPYLVFFFFFFFFFSFEGGGEGGRAFFRVETKGERNKKKFIFGPGQFQ